MKGNNDAWNICRNQCIVNGWLFRSKLVKGDNSGCYKIINNERELRDVVYHLYQAIQATSEDLNCPELFKTNQYVQVALSSNKPEVCIRQAR